MAARSPQKVPCRKYTSLTGTGSNCCWYSCLWCCYSDWCMLAGAGHADCYAPCVCRTWAPSTGERSQGKAGDSPAATVTSCENLQQLCWGKAMRMTMQGPEHETNERKILPRSSWGGRHPALPGEGRLHACG